MAKNSDADLSAVTLISKLTQIKGDLETDSDIRIDGRIEGNVVTKGRLIIGATGNVKGDVSCQNAEVAGSITGKVQVADLFSLLSTSNFEGELITSKLMVEPGANFTATCKMNSTQK